MSTKIASLYAEIGADTSKLEAGTKKTRNELDKTASAFAKFSAEQSKQAKSYLAVENQKQKAIKESERLAARAAKEAAKAAEIQRRNSLVIAPGLEKTRGKVQEIIAANQGLIATGTAVAGVMVAIGVALDKASDKAVAYANDVRKLQQINGQSAESNSRLIQVLDDYKLTVDDIAVASKKLKDNGLTPTIDTIAKLATQYQAIQDPAEKLKFAQDNLGKSSQAWLDVLSKSPEILRQQAAGISENLVLTQKQVDAARKLELAEDAKNDAMQAVSVTLGNKIIPLQTDVLNGLNVWIRAIQDVTENQSIWTVSTKDFLDATDKAGSEIYQEQQAMIAASDAAEGLDESNSSLTESTKETEEAARKLSSVYTGLLSSMFSIQSSNDGYAKTMDDLIQKDADLAAEKDKLTLKMWEEQAAGKLTNEENLDYIRQLAEITDAQAENAQAKEQAQADVEKAAQQRIYDLTQERLAADGIVDSGEFEFLQNIAVQRGLVSKAAADQAISESKQADALVANFAKTQGPMETTLATMQNIAGYNGMVVDFGVNFSTTGVDPQSLPGGYGYAAQRDSGGAGVAGEAYMIGVGAQPELFIPKSDGQFVPNADKKGFGSKTYNITINNPKRETAENSIRASLKKLSYVGVAT